VVAVVLLLVRLRGIINQIKGIVMAFGVSFARELRSLYLFDTAFSKYRTEATPYGLVLAVPHLTQFLNFGVKKCQLKQNDYATYLDYFRWHYDDINQRVTDTLALVFISDEAKQPLREAWQAVQVVLRNFQDLSAMHSAINDFNNAMVNLDRMANRAITARTTKIAVRAGLMAVTQAQLLTEHRCFDTSGHYEPEINDCHELRKRSLKILVRMQQCYDQNQFSEDARPEDVAALIRDLKQKVDLLTTIHEHDRELKEMLDQQISLRYSGLRAYYNKTAIERYIQDISEQLANLKATIRTVAARVWDKAGNIVANVGHLVMNPREAVANISHALANPADTWNTFKEWFNSRPWWQSALYVVGGAAIIIGGAAIIGTGIGAPIGIAMEVGLVAAAATGAGIGAGVGALVVGVAGINNAGAADRAIVPYREQHAIRQRESTASAHERALSEQELASIEQQIKDMENAHRRAIEERERQVAEENRRRIAEMAGADNHSGLMGEQARVEGTMQQAEGLRDEISREHVRMETEAERHERELQEQRAKQRRLIQNIETAVVLRMPELNAEDLAALEEIRQAPIGGAGALPAEAAVDRDTLNRVLFQAAFNGDAIAVISALDAGADINSQHPDPRNSSLIGKTPLFIAAELGNGAVVIELLKRGAVRSIKDSGGWSPRRIASVMFANGNHKCAEYVANLEY
jgi:hypothetical protein